MRHASLLLLFILVMLAGCKKKDIVSNEQYARFYARKCLLKEHFRHRDSLDKYLSGLYETEGVTPDQIVDFVKEREDNPEEWAETQDLIVKEIEKLNPDKIKKRRGAHKRKQKIKAGIKKAKRSRP
jgi:hypothetical protein